MKILDRRRAGVMVPLFALRNGDEWGVGELPDLPRFAAWAKQAGLSCVLTLPLLEPSPGQESPYSSCSFFALDPLYIAIEQLEDFAGRTSLDPEETALLEEVEGAPRVSHDKVRRLKLSVLARCFAQYERSVDRSSTRAKDLTRFELEHAHWLPDYALFRALKAQRAGSWRDWPAPLRDAEPAALAAARADLADGIRFRIYLQWIAFGQLQAARSEMNALGVGLIGDEPFLVADDAADVWARQDLFRADATVGAPPDAYSADGQDWGLPPYRWDAIRAQDYALFQERGAHTAKLYDAIRIDHLVGLYRTYLRQRDHTQKHRFDPEVEPEQLSQGEAIVSTMRASGVDVIAEDLGVIPDFVRASLAKLQVPGHRVLRWEQERGRFREPATYPELSMATTGTHDTETSADWWEGLGEQERVAFTSLDGMKHLTPKDERWSEAVWGALLWKTISASSRLAILPIQDLLSLRTRINTPGTMGPDNWSLRLPWTLSAMESDAIVRARVKLVRKLCGDHGRM